MAEIATQPSGAPARLARFYAFQITIEARFIHAIWLVYLQSRGLSLTQIGLVEASFHLAPVLLEVTAGSFADLFGHRRALVASAGLTALSAALLWGAGSLPVAMLAAFLWGASYSFRSGTDQAYLYESLGAAQGGYIRLFGRLLGAAYLLGAATLWVGAALSTRGYWLPFALAAGAGLLALWLAAGLPEIGQRRAAPGKRRPLRGHIADIALALAARPALAAMLVCGAAFWTAAAVGSQYLPAALAARGFTNDRIGAVLAAALVLDALGNALAGRVGGSGGFGWRFATLAGIAGIGWIGASAAGAAVAVAAYLATQVAAGLLKPLLSGWFNARIPSAQRVTLLSMESWLFSLFMIAAFPLAGWWAQRAGWGALYATLGALTLALAMLVLAGWRWQTVRAARLVQTE